MAAPRKRAAADKPKAAKKSAREAPTAPALIPRPDGKGALLSGGVPGNKGGTGRPPSVIRELLRGSFADRIQTLQAIADGEQYATSDRLKALDMLAKYGLGTSQEVTGTDGGPQENTVTVRFVHE